MLSQITAFGMVNNRSKLALNCEVAESDNLSNLSRSGSKLGHIDDDLVEGLKENKRMILEIIQL